MSYLSLLNLLKCKYLILKHDVSFKQKRISTNFNFAYASTILFKAIAIAHFEKCEQLLEYQKYLLLRDQISHQHLNFINSSYIRHLWQFIVVIFGYECLKLNLHRWECITYCWHHQLLRKLKIILLKLSHLTPLFKWTL